MTHELVGALIQTARHLAEKAGIAKSGYRTVFNCNAEGGQVVFHLHLHLLGGRPLHWPPWLNLIRLWLLFFFLSQFDLHH